MTERKQYTEGELEEIAEAVWGTGEIRLDHVPCPRCGADIRVSVSPILRPPPPRFRAICSTCGIDSSGKATSVEMRQLTEEEIEDVLELYLRGERPVCPACHSPLDVEEQRPGRGVRYFVITCRRCGSRGQRRWSPEGSNRP